MDPSLQKKVPSGCEPIDKLLEGGLENDAITVIYGPFSSGKTNIAMIAAIKIVTEQKKVICIDTESSFSIERFKQLDENYKETLKHIIFIRPTSFLGLHNVLEKLDTIVNKNVGLIIVDSIAMFYRLKASKKEEGIRNINKDLRVQIHHLSKIAREKHIPVLLTNQVYANFEEREKVNMVGGDLLAYDAKCLIELQKARKGFRKAILKKHRSLPEEKEVTFKIEEKGLVMVANS